MVNGTSDKAIAVTPTDASVAIHEPNNRHSSISPTPISVTHSEGSSLFGNEGPSTWTKEKTIQMKDDVAPALKTTVSSRDWSVERLVESGGKHFKPITRVSVVEKPLHEVRKIISEYEKGGIPLVVGDWHKLESWPKHLFNVDWLLEHGEQKIQARNCLDRRDREMSLQDFINTCRTASKFAIEGETERLYGKDAACPQEWYEWLLGSELPEEILPNHRDNMLNVLTETERVETLMCYLGIGDTFTPAHKDLCASTGHNLMCYTEEDGSSFWFMTETSAADKTSELFHSHGSELDHEGLVATTETFKGADFTVFVAEQKLGDFVLVPPRCCHQVVNYGGLTIKLSWSRMMVHGIVSAFHYELPLYRRVCRVETYRIKLTCYRALIEYTKRCRTGLELCNTNHSTPTTQHEPSAAAIGSLVEKLRKDGHRLTALVNCFNKILKEEYSSREEGKSLNDGTSTNEDGLSCDYCGADIFHAYFECATQSCLATGTSSAVPNAGTSVAALPLAPQITASESTDTTMNPVAMSPCESSSDMAVSDMVSMEGGDADVNTKPAVVIPVPPPDGPDTIVICTACYAEGRVCACEQMRPRSRLNMTELLKAQHEAVDALKRFRVLLNEGNQVDVPVEWHPKSMRVLDHPEFLDSALVVLKHRNRVARDKEYVCSSLVKNINASHTVPALSAINCGKCRRRLCVHHLLERGIHASDIFCSARENIPNDDDSWHKFHVQQSKKLKGHMEILEKQIALGRLCSVRSYLIKLATKYKYSSPLHPIACQPGWYDVSIYYDQRLSNEATTPPEATIPPPMTKGVEIVLQLLPEEEKSKYIPQLPEPMPPVDGLVSVDSEVTTAEAPLATAQLQETASSVVQHARADPVPTAPIISVAHSGTSTTTSTTSSISRSSSEDDSSPESRTSSSGDDAPLIPAPLKRQNITQNSPILTQSESVDTVTHSSVEASESRCSPVIGIGNDRVGPPKGVKRKTCDSTVPSAPTQSMSESTPVTTSQGPMSTCAPNASSTKPMPPPAGRQKSPTVPKRPEIKFIRPREYSTNESPVNFQTQQVLEPSSSGPSTSGLPSSTSVKRLRPTGSNQQPRTKVPKSNSERYLPLGTDPGSTSTTDSQTSLRVPYKKTNRLSQRPPSDQTWGAAGRTEIDRFQGRNISERQPRPTVVSRRIEVSPQNGNVQFGVAPYTPIHTQRDTDSLESLKLMVESLLDSYKRQSIVDPANMESRLADLEKRVAQQEAQIQEQAKALEKMERIEELLRHLQPDVFDVRKRFDELSAQYRVIEAILAGRLFQQNQTPTQTNDDRGAGPSPGSSHNGIGGAASSGQTQHMYNTVTESSTVKPLHDDPPRAPYKRPHDYIHSGVRSTPAPRISNGYSHHNDEHDNPTKRLKSRWDQAPRRNYESGQEATRLPERYDRHYDNHRIVKRVWQPSRTSSVPKDAFRPSHWSDSGRNNPQRGESQASSSLSQNPRNSEGSLSKRHDSPPREQEHDVGSSHSRYDYDTHRRSISRSRSRHRSVSRTLVGDEVTMDEDRSRLDRETQPKTPEPQPPIRVPIQEDRAPSSSLIGVLTTDYQNDPNPWDGMLSATAKGL